MTDLDTLIARVRELGSATIDEYSEEFAALTRMADECERLRACMAKAGLAAFMRDGDPEAVAEHLRSVIVERRDGKAAATIADLRDRLRIMAPMVCEGCGCAVSEEESGGQRCDDCQGLELYRAGARDLAGGGYYSAACISVGLRALCGRKLLDGC